MGQTVSTGVDNDELIDNLVEADYIKTTKIQRIFRAVDRANYFLEGQRENAYRDTAWRAGNLHLSAPCVYSGVMESLKLRRGLSFLNLGSGCGYLSTMAGLILGPYGINHGIELYSDVIDYAYEKLEKFIKESEAVDEYDFCEPTFLSGNCLKIDNMQLYDRVYCGAACPLEYETYMKHLIKVGGVLIMPLNNRLLRITRTDASTWESSTIFTVSFAPLMSPADIGPTELVKLPEFTPPSLQILCRSKIRAVLRNRINKEYPDLQKSKVDRCTQSSPQQFRQIMIPFIDVTDSSDSDNERERENPNFIEFRNPHAKITISRLPLHASDFIKNYIRTRRDFQEAGPSNASNETNNAEENPSKGNGGRKKAKKTESNDISSANSDSEASQDSSNDKEDKYKEYVLSMTTRNMSKSSSKKTSSKSSNKKSTKKESSKKRQLSDTESGSRKKRVKMPPRRTLFRNRITSVVCRRFPAPENIPSSQKKTVAKKPKPSTENPLNYRKLMAEKIITLPLPPRVQMYINYRRDNMCN